MPRTRRPPHAPPLPKGKQPAPPVGEVGRRLARLMAAKGISQIELTRMTGIPQSRLSTLIRGKIERHNMQRLMRIAEVLEVRLEDVAGPLARERLDELRAEVLQLEAALGVASPAGGA